MNEPRTVRRPALAVVAGALALCALLALPLNGAVHAATPLQSAVGNPSTSPTSCRVGTGPGFPGYDPVTHHVYVPNEVSGNITVLGGTCTKVGTIHLPSGASPISAVFDPANDLMYVTDDGLDQVYAISGLTIHATITSPLIQGPREAVWDPGDAMVLFTNDYGNYSVIGIQGTTVVGQVGVGSDPQAICFDPYFDTVLVVNFLSQNVTILNGYAPLSGALATAAVGFDPSGCVFDPATNEDYVTNYGDDNVSVISGFGYEVGAIAVGDLPRGIGWDQASLQVFVGNTLHGGVSVIGASGTVVKSLNPGAKSSEGMAFDDSNNRMYLASFSGNDVFVLS